MYNNPYTSIFISCILIGALLGYIYWRFIENRRELDGWSSNTVSTMIFFATGLTILVLFIVNNPIFPIVLVNKNPHIISVSTYHQKRIEQNTVVLDLRIYAKFQNFHFANAISLDFYDKKFQKKIDNLEKFKVYLLYCDRNEICMRTEKILVHQGFHQIFYAPALNKPKKKEKKK
jgi:rhodanese-related sulfurtransferase